MRFLIYTGERVLHSDLESERVRVMTLEYFPQDGSIRVFEPEEDNSGLWSGDFAKRHMPVDAEGGPLKLDAIASAGDTIRVHGREFVVADADVFVRGDCYLKIACKPRCLYTAWISPQCTRDRLHSNDGGWPACCPALNAMPSPRARACPLF